MRFEDHFIQQVRGSTDIVGLVSGYVNLKKQGANYSGLCPFHSEKTPSFKVNPNLQIFKCFGCGQGGDAFRFLELMEGLSFPEAIRQLAERQGIALPHQDPQQEKRAERRERWLELMRAAAKFFETKLRGNEGRRARAYLENRGITPTTIEAFGLGFAPRGSRLQDEILRLGFDAEDGLTCGLLVRNDRGEAYDKFRDRIIFPIRDLTGKVIAFGGRALADFGPKYLNSPETPLYHKSHHLYGLDLAREEIRRRNFSILVEGYFDCVAPHQFGFRNVVASLGTSLTENQVKILGRYSPKVVINFDPDAAGIAAVVRSIDLFGQAGMQVNVVELPAGSDPDSFLRQEGPDGYRRQLQSSLPYLDFLLDKFLEAERDPATPRGKQAVANQILPYLARIPNQIERAEEVARVASRLKIEERLLHAELRKLSRPTRRAAELPLKPQLAQPTRAEMRLLEAALDPGLAPDLLPQLDASLFQGLVTEPIFQKLLQQWKLHGEISVLVVRDQLEEEHEKHLLESVAVPTGESALTQEVIEECIRALRLKQQQVASRSLQQEISRAEARGDSRELGKLLQRKEELRRRMELDMR